MPTPSSSELEIIKRMQVPDCPHLYILGSFEIRVTFYNQQVRALNLVYAMRKLMLPNNAKIAVVGAGASGLTFAAAAAIWGGRDRQKLGWQIHVLDHRPDILSLIGHGSARWLHPHVYEWPNEGSESRDAGLCVMNWTTGTAGTVIDYLRPQWEAAANEYGILLHLGISGLTIKGPNNNGRYLAGWYGKGPIGAEGPPIERSQLSEFDVVILGVGFGLEEKSENFQQVTSYWAADNLERDEPVLGGTRKKILVSGTGDGGLIDVLRLSFRRFRHDMILQQLQTEWLTSDDLHHIKERINQIEAKAEQDKAAGKVDYEAQLNLAYRDMVQRIRLPAMLRREELDIWHCGRSGYPLGLHAARLNRFLYTLTPTQYIESELVEVRPSQPSGYVVHFANGESRNFDEVIIRHGPAKALKKHFPVIAGFCATMEVRAKVTPDPSRTSVYDVYFDELLRRAWQAIISNHPHETEEARTQAAAALREYRAGLRAERQRIRDWRGQERFLGDLFVPPSVVSNAALDAASEGDHAIKSVVWRPEIAGSWLSDGPARRVLFGESGTGKTTLLQYLAACAAVDEDTFPILESLPDLATGNLDAATTISKFLFEAALPRIGATDDNFKEVLHDRYLASLSLGKVMLLLDDFHALPANAQSRLAAMIERDVDFGRCGNLLIITSADTGESPYLAHFVGYKIMAPTLSFSRRLLARHGVDQEFSTYILRLLAGCAAFRPLGCTVRSLIEWASAVAQADSSLPKWQRLPMARFADGVPSAYTPDHIVSQFIAARELTSGPCAVREIIKLAHDLEQSRREMPAMAIALLQTPSRVLETLEAIPESLDYALLRLRIRALRYLEDRPGQAVERLAEALKDLVMAPDLCPGFSLKQVAGEFAGSSDAVLTAVRQQIEPLLQEESDAVCCRAIDVVGAARLPNAAAILMGCLLDRRYERSETASRALIESADPEAVTALLRAVRGSPSFGVTSIAHIDSDASIPALLSLIEASQPKLAPGSWAAAARTLSDIGERRAVEPLIRALTDWEYRADAADALATLGDPRGAVALRPFLDKQWPSDLRSNAARAQRILRDPETSAVLIELMNDDDYNVSDAAARSLMQINCSALLDLLRTAAADTTVANRAHRLALLAEIAGVEALPAILPLASNKDQGDRYAAAKGLGFIDTPAATGELCRLARYDTENVSYRAVEQLEGRRDDRVVGTLAEVMSGHRFWQVRVRAVQALREIANPAALDSLCGALKDHEVAGYAAMALGVLGSERAIPALLAAWPDSPPVPDAIPLAIGRIGGRAGALALFELLTREELASRRQAILRGLGELQHADVVPGLLLGLADQDAGSRVLARDALWFLPPPILRDGLRVALSHELPSVRRQAATVIAFYADEILIPILSLLGEIDPDPEAKQAARCAIGQVRRKDAALGAL